MSSLGIKNAALAYQAIEQFFKHTPANNPASIDDAWQIMKDHHAVKNKQQVIDCVKSLYKNGKLARIREGIPYKYWGRIIPDVPSIVLPKYEPLPTEVPILPDVSVPEVTVSKEKITIKHSKYRITIDLT